MNKKLGIALVMGTLQASALAYSAIASAQATFYEDEAFRGRSFTAQQPQVGNFERSELNNNASSAVIVGSRWEVCSERRFGGNCMVLRPGRYPSLASFGMNDRISSARAVSANTRITDDRYAPAPLVAQVTFYENENFGGRTFTTERPVDNFQRVGFNDRASSVEVVGDRFEVCDDAGFRGNCMVLRPGRYSSLRSMGMNDRISSVRAIAPTARIDDNRYAPAYSPQANEQRDYRRRGQERLYQANVVSVRAVVGAAEQRCWVEKEPVPQGPTSNISVPGAIGGAVICGIIGHQLGGHNSKDLATVGGAAIGGLAGANINRITGQPQQPQTQDVQKCASAPSQTPTYYDVSYNFRGQDHRVQMTSQPGPTVTVNEQGEPRT